MAKFRKGNKSDSTGINTASLPDIVFMLLFFFMVITTIRNDNPKVTTRIPNLTEVERLELKSRVHTILVGPPSPKYEKIYGSTPRIQLNDDIAKIEKIKEFIIMERENALKGTEELLTTSIKADREEVKMGIITDVKQELRKVGQYKVSYAATPDRTNK